jgi:hemerythrin-like domain-containing protein
MKRTGILRDLSSEHHRALALSRDIIKAYKSSITLGPFISRAREEFVNQLLPHFRVEEEKVLPVLAKAGESTLVEQILEEHRKLNYLNEHLEEPGQLLEFAEMLKAHVRLEERVLFEKYRDVVGDVAS